MGNTSSNVTSGIKKQADGSSLAIYQLLDVKGGGEFVKLMKKTAKSKNYDEVDEIIRTKLKPFLYNEGRGKQVPISELVLLRNKERPKHKQLQGPKSVQTTESANSCLEKTDNDVNGTMETLKHAHGPYREVCWDVNLRGAVGESGLHLCLLNATSLHADLAKRFIRVFPNLINDVYLCDEYYGEGSLHMAIVNEDPVMVKFLLDNGVDYHERAIGNFFYPEDQKESRTDTLEQEQSILSVKTNYEGYVYWGEYPLSFAACLGQEECYRLVLAKGADPNKQDCNGNTVLHLLVIHEKVNMFDMAFELGAFLDIRNNQGLSPLTLAAKLARKEMFSHILKLERQIYWHMGRVTCAAYPLHNLDTIDCNTGVIDKNSALNLIVYGDKLNHLEMMDGVILDLLNAKWNSFVKFRFYKMLAFFSIYFVINFACFLLRPVRSIIPPSRFNETFSANASLSFNLNSSNFALTSINVTYAPIKEDYCYLMQINDNTDLIRLITEGLTVFGAFLYLIGAARECWFLGGQMFIESLMTVPSRVLFLSSCILVGMMLPMRLTCASRAEDTVAVLVMLTTSLYFLFFCRGFKMVGPFVVMVYKMILGDLLRFVAIYLVFVIGFSQAFYIIFQSYKGDDVNNYFQDPVKSIMAMFVMSLQDFGSIYSEFSRTDHNFAAKFLFIIYMALVAILLVNMLIAMMGTTYQIIAETHNEWQRQWARIVLVVERAVSPKERLRRQMLYSQTMADGRLAFILRHQMSEDDKKEMKEMQEMKLTHMKYVKRRRKDIHPLQLIRSI